MSALGADLGQRQMRYAVLQSKAKSVVLQSLQEVSFSHPRDLQSAFSSLKMSVASSRFDLEGDDVFFEVVWIPEVPKDELGEILPWAMTHFKDKHDQTQFVFRYSRTPSLDRGGKIAFAVYAVEKKHIAKRVQWIKSMKPKNFFVLEPSFVSLARCVIHNYSDLLESNQYLGVVDMGKKFSHFMAVSRNGIVFNRVLIDMAASALDRSLARDLGVSVDEAEELKLGRGQREISSEHEKILSNTTTHFYSKSAIELQRSMDLMLNEVSQGASCKKILFAGGGAKLTGFIKYMADTLKVECLPIDPVRKIQLAPSVQRSGVDPYLFDVAIGLALDGYAAD